MEKIKKSDHFYLIDGSGYIFRAYYALPPLTRKSDGLPVGAVSGFCNMLFKLLEDSKSKPHTLTLPEFFITVPASIFKKVVFPAPLGPSKPKISPSFTSKFKLLSACVCLEPFFE